MSVFVPAQLSWEVLESFKHNREAVMAAITKLDMAEAADPGGLTADTVGALQIRLLAVRPAFQTRCLLCSQHVRADVWH